MSTIDDIRGIRLQKLKSLHDSGILAYPAKTKRTHTVAEALALFSKLFKSKKDIVIAGRIMALRGHGGATFLDIQDGTGKLQGLIKTDKVGEKGYQFLINHFDIGDFIEIKGNLITTKRGEKTIEATDYTMLSKALRPLPEKWHGLQDVEERLRKRYLDILSNPEIKEIVAKRSLFWNAMREFLLQRGFLEVETPVLENITGGAETRPFITRHNAMDLDVYLRISAGELWQKRLLVAGIEKTFEIGRIFRNEGMDAEHLQDYTQMECYWAYSDYEKGMEFTEELYKYIIQKTFGTLKFTIRGFEVDFGARWEKYDFVSTIAKYTKVNILEASLPEMEKALQKLKIDYDKKGFNITRAVDNLWKYCRKNIGGPGFLMNVPDYMEPLAKRNEKNPRLVQRFQVIVGGSENGKGFSELNDPVDQEQRFADQQKLRDKGDEEAQMFDTDYVEAMEYGMPPAFGFGVSERLFSFLMNKPARETQIFPLMRPKIESSEKSTPDTTPPKK